MITWYKRIRVVAYTAGFSGLIAVFTGKNLSDPKAEQFQIVGAGCIAISFTLLFISYVLYSLIRIRRKKQ